MDLNQRNTAARLCNSHRPYSFQICKSYPKSLIYTLRLLIYCGDRKIRASPLVKLLVVHMSKEEVKCLGDNYSNHSSGKFDHSRQWVGSSQVHSHGQCCSQRPTSQKSASQNVNICRDSLLAEPLENIIPHLLQERLVL